MTRLPRNFNIERYGLKVRLVNENDASFIVSLRTDDKLGRYINKTSPSIEEQIKWTNSYKLREELGIDYYFLFEKPSGNPIGVCRIYDVTTNTFTIGSWLFKKDAPVGSAILADIITRELAFELFPFSKLLFDVKKDNINVNRYQATYKPEIIRCTEDAIFYSCPQDNFEKFKKIHLRMFAPKTIE